MKVEFSIHALDRMVSRSITKQEVLEVLNNYDSMIDQDEETRIFLKLVVESNKPYLYRVFINKSKKPWLVITVYRTSKIEKYGYKIQ
jgi:hypothetical protein